MLLIVGSVVVIAAIVAGYLMEGGALMALYQPAELVIIGGAALGSMLISTPMPLLSGSPAASAGSSRTARASRNISRCSGSCTRPSASRSSPA